MSQTPPPPPPVYQPQPPFSPADQRTFSTLVHVLGIFFGFWPSLIGYLIAKDRGAFIRDHTRRALNFHLTALIAYVVGGVLLIVVVGIFVLIAVAVLTIVFEIMAAIASNEGRLFTYPIAIDFIRP